MFHKYIESLFGLMDRASNNKFPGNPGIMADGRLFTNYTRNVDYTQLMNQKYLGHHHNDHLLRQYLTHNGQNIMDENFLRISENTKCRNVHSKKLGHNAKDSARPGNNDSAFIDFVARPKNLM